MKQAILVVSFGTTHLDTLEKTICAVEREVQNAFPQIPCFRAFTSRVIRKRLAENHGMLVDSVESALEKLEKDGFSDVYVQPTLLLAGEEFNKLHAAILQAAGNLNVRIGRPLLWDDADMIAMAKALKESYPVDEDTVLLAMGHGTSHSADAIYSRLYKIMQAQGMELCTVEGAIDFEAAKENLLQQSKRKVHLVPMLIVAGDHSKNDMASDEPNSLKSILTAAGFEVTCSLKGLGELKAVQNAFVKRIRQ